MKPAKKAPERSFEPSLYVIKESPECWLIREAFIKKDGWVSDLHSLYCPSSKKDTGFQKVSAIQTHWV